MGKVIDSVPNIYKTLFIGIVLAIMGLLIGAYANPKVKMNTAHSEKNGVLIDKNEKRIDAHDVTLGKNDTRWEMIQDDIQEIKQAVKER